MKSLRAASMWSPRDTNQEGRFADNEMAPRDLCSGDGFAPELLLEPHSPGTSGLQDLPPPARRHVVAPWRIGACGLGPCEVVPKGDDGYRRRAPRDPRVSSLRYRHCKQPGERIPGRRCGAADSDKGASIPHVDSDHAVQVQILFSSEAQPMP
jgi:hypothetical protein